MSAQAQAAGWVDVLAELEHAVDEGELLVDRGRLEELRALPVPVVATSLPPELVARGRELQERMVALATRLAEAMAATRQDLELAATERADHPDRAERPARRQWQPTYVDARA